MNFYFYQFVIGAGLGFIGGVGTEYVTDVINNVSLQGLQPSAFLPQGGVTAETIATEEEKEAEATGTTGGEEVTEKSTLSWWIIIVVVLVAIAAVVTWMIIQKKRRY